MTEVMDNDTSMVENVDSASISEKVSVQSSGTSSQATGSEPVKLFIGNLKHGATKDELLDLFHPFGPIDLLDVKHGFAFITLAKSEEAVRELHGFEFLGREMVVEISTGKSSKGSRSGKDTPNARIFVGNFADTTTRDDLRDLFSPYGDIDSVDVVSTFGFVVFKDLDSAVSAQDKLHGHILKGNPLTVEFSSKSGSNDRRRRDISRSRRRRSYSPSPRYRNRSPDRRRGGDDYSRSRRGRSPERRRSRSRSRDRYYDRRPMYADNVDTRHQSRSQYDDRAPYDQHDYRSSRSYSRMEEDPTSRHPSDMQRPRYGNGIPQEHTYGQGRDYRTERDERAPPAHDQRVPGGHRTYQRRS